MNNILSPHVGETLVDIPAERAVLGGLFQHGRDAYLDIADFVKVGTFSYLTNQALFRAISHLYEQDGITQLGEADLSAAMYETGMGYILDRPDEVRYIRSIINARVGFSNIRRWAAKLRKLEIARLLVEQLEAASVDVQRLTGNEPIEHILGLAENAIFDFTSLISADDDGEPELITNGLPEYLDYIESNPVENVGISSGFPYYDHAIGGGFRRGTVSLIGARPKVGKSMLAISIALHIAKNLGIPVLYLDTEMIKKDHWARLLPMVAKQNKASITINELETGQYAQDELMTKQVHEALEHITRKTWEGSPVEGPIPFYYKNITGKPFEDILGIMRRWVHKEVGLDEDGNVNDCIIIYDYMKLMSADSINEGLKEYQILGFMTTTLHNFAVRHDTPVLSFIQLNREGESSDGGAVISQSDRILWLVTNFCQFKTKTDEEIAEMGPQQGNRKMVPVVARHGEGLTAGDYINMNMEGRYGYIQELELRSVVNRRRQGRDLHTPITELGLPDDAWNDESISGPSEDQRVDQPGSGAGGGDPS